MKYYKFIFILIILFLTSCATKTTFQVDGMPIQDNFVRAKTFNLGLIVKYQMTQYFNVKEGDESYESYEYLPLTNPQIHKIDNPTKMEININVFNENKESYKIIKYITKVNRVLGFGCRGFKRLLKNEEKTKCYFLGL